MRSRLVQLAAAMTAMLPSVRAVAQSFPARSGETGILDVPDAEIAGRGGGQLATEFRFDHVPGQPDDVGPLPIYVVAGISENADLGLTMREWGEPGDERPARLLFGAAAKLQLVEPRAWRPGVAASAVFDRLNADGVVGARLATSVGTRALRVAAFAGGEARTDGFGSAGLTAGLAASVGVTRRLSIAAEALTGPRGEDLGLAFRWSATPTFGIAVGGNWFPGDESFRLGVTIAMSSPPAKPPPPEPSVVAATATAEEPPALPTGFTDERPRFRLKIPVAGDAGRPAHQQGGALRVASAEAAPQKPEPGSRPVAPSLEDLADAQLKEQETLAATRERRVRDTATQLDAREQAALDEQKRLADRERELAAREQQLDARQRAAPAKGPPTQQQRQLESLEAQLASQERSLVAQERSYGPALDAAQGRARDAAMREEAERQEASRLTASLSGTSSRAVQLDARKQANAATNRQLAALEARLVARGEYIDSLERQLRTKGERLDAWSRRLDTRAERLELLERLGAEPKAPPAGARPAGTAAPATTPKGQAALVMVVKSPTAIVKERAATPSTAAAAPAVHAGTAVEKAVAAATVVMFPTPASQMSELDLEALTNIAKLAGRERCELLIWARAKDPGAMSEAQRRATDIQARVVAAGPLDPGQVVTRITVRPGANGVDVVVSALRDTSKPAAVPAAPGTPKLLSGESGNRQLREAVQAAQTSIEACVGEFLDAKRASRAEGVLKLSVGPAGRVTRVTTGGGEISGAQVEECLGAASKRWAFPAADGEYVVDVPITVMRGGGR